ncbi:MULTISPECIES: class I SAM-dependent methyltransferase [Streptomyces]|uniref:class I SAM-dependent methyltransferase n=1 Tax=Streptomyces TaxID=1883 RepID=UPI00140E903B|nr:MULTISPECIES: class I SAM-dependent methyltransferase [Streptomyces]MDH6223432.1 SAM-dependent methyltransferase [Streptomyces sp. MJP52]
MTRHHTHGHGHPHAHPRSPARHGGHHDHGGDAAHAGLLELEARTFAPALEEALARAVTRLGPADPRHAADLGSGPGVGTLALARRLPAARVTAVDRSPVMLERVLAAARDAGLAERVRVAEADLDAGLPDLGPLDVVWASSSLHHVADPAALLGRLHGAVAPGGLLIVVESDGMPRFLPEDAGAGRPGLEERCRAVTAAAGWNAHPDWRDDLERAGFGPVDRWTVTAEGAPGEEAAHYAHLVLGRIRGALEDQLDPEDLAALDRILTPGDPAFVGRRRDLVPRSVRTVWAARRA